MNNSLFFRLDWLSVLIYICLVSFGLLNIYSTTYDESPLMLWNPSTAVGKQLWIFIGCLLALPFMAYIKSNFFEHLSYVFYGLSILSLLGLFVFGQTISGATSWYGIGGFGLQPAEFTKITTALVIANFLSDIQTDIRKNKYLLRALLIVLIPVILIVLQPDAGSALVFFGLFFVFIREGLDFRWLFLGLGLILVFIITLLLKPLMVSLGAGLIVFLIYNFLKKSKTKKSPFLLTLGVCVLFSYSVDFIFNSVFEQRHRDRFNIILGLETDTSGIGYNINQSKIAIGSGGFSGKGYLNGTQTKGNFVPEQHTDYIFSTIGEEWGFIGSSVLIGLFTLLIFRIVYRAEKQSSAFRRIYSYGFASMLFIHFFVNIGMTLGLVPTVGIPLPFISYGGSSLMAFSLMLFIYLNFDSQRLS
ncbi:rod shape-determining protein RodA [Flavobacteriaceae bacterium]|nr:rod shape-determining protein RodA [Flavobacteriaceae bacterium]MDC3354027.1 rod shape-determining protein RodA [Flavobacteriaceae bacterium]